MNRVAVGLLSLALSALERMIDFYCRVIGCTVERRRDDLGLVHLRAGRSQIDLVPVDQVPLRRGRGHDHSGRLAEPPLEGAAPSRVHVRGAVGQVQPRRAGRSR